MSWRDCPRDESVISTVVQTLLALGASFRAAAIEVPCSAKDNLLKGWDIHQWSDWGRRKSSIASSVCRENGKLKAELTRLRLRIAELENLCNDVGADLQVLDDPLWLSDPWAGATVHAKSRDRMVNVEAWDLGKIVALIR